MSAVPPPGSSPAVVDQPAPRSGVAVLGAFVKNFPQKPGVDRMSNVAGDVLYVPPGWGHAVLNLNTSVGVAIEFSSVFG